MDAQNKELFLVTVLLLCFIGMYETKTGKRRHLSEPPTEAYDRTMRKYGNVEDIVISDKYITGTLWPKPQSERRGKELYSFDPNKFVFNVTKAKNSVLSAAFSRYKKIVFPESDVKASEDHPLIKALNVEMKEENSALGFDSDESCK